MKDVFMIVYTESGDEIHFIIMDSKLENEYDKLYEDIIVKECLTDGKYDRTDEFLSFVWDNMLESKFVQTYTEENWFENYNIIKVYYVPELGN